MEEENNKHVHFMRRALELATLGSGHVSPNPLVGCVVVCGEKILGEGWHKILGGPHAEVHALQSVADPSRLKESTVYVNLEPCSHQGRTPPCADLLIQHQVKKVVVANLDPNPKVNGEGIKKLRSAGIEVVTGIMAEEGRRLNKRFFTFMEKQRPFFVLKWAATADGFMAQSNGDSKWISHARSRQLVHKWRSEEDGVLVGMKTAFHDNPRLTVRDWSGRNPVRIVIDRFLKLHDSLSLFDQSTLTLCYNVLKHEERDNLIYLRKDEEGFMEQVVADLYQRQIQSVMVEGGSITLQHFIDLRLWDEVREFVSRRTFGQGLKAPVFQGLSISREILDGDVLTIYHPLN